MSLTISPSQGGVLDADLTAIAALSGTSGLLRKTAADTWALDVGAGTGTVTSVIGAGTVSGVSLSGTVTSSGNLTLGGTLAVTPSNFTSQTAATFLAAPNEAAGVPSFRTIIAADVPTLNQSTTGNAGTVTNGVYTTNKDASGGVPGLTLFSLNLKNAANTFTNYVTNATTASRTWTLPDYDGTLATLAGTETLTNKTLTTPSIDSLNNVIIGNSVPATGGFLALSASGSNSGTATDTSSPLDLKCTDAWSQNSGSSIGFYARTDATTTQTLLAKISGRKETNTSGNKKGYIAFETRGVAGSPVERMRINSVGQMYIGTTTGLSGGTLQVRGTISIGTDAQPISGTAIGGLISSGFNSAVQGNGPSIQYIATQDWTVVDNGAGIAFSTTANNTINPTEKVRIDDKGSLGVGTADPSTFGKLVVVGAGTTSATNSIVAQNAAGSTTFAVRDDGAVTTTASGGDAFTITNTGAGASFVVTDETADTTTFVIQADGKAALGYPSNGAALVKKLQVNGVGSETAIRLKETATYGVSWDIDVGSANRMNFTHNGGADTSYNFDKGSVHTSSGFVEHRYRDTGVAVTSGGLVRFASLGTGSYTYQINTAAGGDFTSVITAYTISSTGAITIPGAATVAEVSITGGAFGTGKLYTTAAGGMVLTGKTGSANDFMLLTPAGGNIAYVPTGTNTMAYSGNIGIGTPSPAGGGGGTTLQVHGDTAASIRVSAGVGILDMFSSTTAAYIQTTTAIPIIFRTNVSEAMRIGGAGQVTLTNSLLTPAVYFSGASARLSADMTTTILGSTGFAVQTSTANSQTQFSIIPNGTSKSSFLLLSSGTSVNENYIQLGLNNTGSQASLIVGKAGTGTDLPLLISVGGAERLRIDTAGNLGVNGAPKAWASDKRAIEFPNANSSIWAHDTNKAISLSANYYFGAAGKTTIATGTTAEVQVLNTGIYFRTYTSSTAGALIPSTPAASFVIDTGGSALLSTPTGLLGYGTGAGGTVTQATSKSTGVVLNKPCGQITMNAAALASGATVVFSMSNSLFSMTDTVIANLGALASGSSGSDYALSAYARNPTEVTFVLKNISVGSRSEAVVINFAIIKGATT